MLPFHIIELIQINRLTNKIEWIQIALLNYFLKKFAYDGNSLDLSNNIVSKLENIS